MTKIIAFSGRKQSGKSTAGEYLQSLMYSLNPKIDIRTYSFADPLKQICINLLGLSNEQCYGSDEDKNSLTSLRWEDIPDFSPVVVLEISLNCALIVAVGMLPDFAVCGDITFPPLPPPNPTPSPSPSRDAPPECGCSFP